MPTEPNPPVMLNDLYRIVQGLHLVGEYQVKSQAGAAATAELKADRSPVTEIDRKSDAALRAMLGELGSKYPVVSEEVSTEQNIAALQTEGLVWVVDPLDGTRTYLDGYDAFAISIGLLGPADAGGNRTPVFGALFFPKTRTLFYTDPLGQAREACVVARGGDDVLLENRRLLQISPHAPRKADALHVVTGYNDTELRCLQASGNPLRHGPAVGGARSMAVARGNADVASFGHPCSIWDSAATDAIMRAAGGRLFPTAPERAAITGTSLYYGADPERWYQGVPFANPPYLGMNDLMPRQLKIASDVALPRTVSEATRSR